MELIFVAVFHKEESSPSDSDEEADESRRMIKIKASNSHKGPYDFDLLVPVQDIGSAHNVSNSPYHLIRLFFL